MDEKRAINPIWVETEEALIHHNLQLSEHGGGEGVRDLGLLESALARSKNLLAYSSSPPTLFDLAAVYASGIAHNHPFVDGNKRTALVVSLTFLELNGVEIIASQGETYLTFLQLAKGSLADETLSNWFRDHSADLSAG